MNRPFTILTIPLIIGILITYYFMVNSHLVFILLILTILALLYNIIKGSLNQRIILILFLLLGIFLGINAKKSQLIANLDKRLDYTARVEEVVKQEEDFSKYVVNIISVNNKLILEEKMILNVSGDKYLDLGQTIFFDGQLKLPKENTNPRLFNYRLNLMTEKIYTTMSIRDHSLKIIEDENIDLGYRLKSNFSARVIDTFNRYLSEKNASLMTGIFLGQSSYLSDEDIDSYRDMGLAHILAVSGLHIGIIAGFISLVLSTLGIKKKINVIVTLSTIWLYGYLIGFPPSILRSSLMFTILYLSQVIHEPYDSLNSLSFAMFILLLVNPYYLFNLGFQLSFVATFSIIIFTPRIRQRFYPYNNKLSQSLSAILGVQIGLLPFQAYYFNKINILSILTNLMIIPIISIGLILGFMMIFFSPIAYINILIGKILESILNLEYMIFQWLQEIPINTFKVFSPSGVTIIIFYIMLFIIFDIIQVKKLGKAISKTIFLYLIFLLVVNTSSIINDNATELHFIDVGQGDSILIRTKGANYLMDTGGSFFGDYNIAEGVTLPYLEKLGISKLDGLFISHFDADHSQGLPLLLENLDVKNLFASYLPEEEETLSSIKSSGVDIRLLRQGDKLRLDKGLELDVIWPKETLSLNPNNNSLVSILKSHGSSILLTGDIEKEVEYLIKDRLDSPIDIIKVPHHGSNTSSSQELLEALQAKDAIISVGRNNLYNHPSLEVVERYEDLDVKIYRTDDMGLIRLIIDEDGYEIYPYLVKGERQRHDIKTFVNNYLNHLMIYMVTYMLIYIMVKILVYRGDDYYAI